MSLQNPIEDIYSWWVNLFNKHQLGFDEASPDKSESVIAIEILDDAVHLKYEPRHYFFGMDFSSGKSILYTFVPDEGVNLELDSRKELFGDLEKTLNDGFSGKRFKQSFERYFTLPLRADFLTKKFGEKEYGGAIVLTFVRDEAFYGKEGVNHRALNQWKRNVFGKLNKFLEKK